MSNILLVAGYTYINNVTKIKGFFRDSDVKICCAYTREPLTDIKKKYLAQFDEVFDLKNEEHISHLTSLHDQILLVTCTQERDLDVYIQTLRMTQKITESQETLYKKMVHKKTFKEVLHETNPELVPRFQTLQETIPADLTYPQVIKPTGLAGSSFVHVVNSQKEVEDFLHANKETMLENGTEFYNRDVHLITEEFITGPQYSVNAYIDAKGLIALCPIMRVIPAYEIDDFSDTYSAMQYTTTELSEDSFASLKDAVQTIATTFALIAVTAHFDAVLHDGQWKFFEASIRPGGKRDEVYALSHGFDHFLNDIQNKIGLPVDLGSSRKSVAIVQKAATTSGVLSNITHTRTIAQEKSPLVHESKMAKINEPVKPVSQGGGTIARYFIVGKEEQSVINTAYEVRNNTVFTIT